jgi:hypothetical protein
LLHLTLKHSTTGGIEVKLKGIITSYKPLVLRPRRYHDSDAAVEILATAFVPSVHAEGGFDPILSRPSSIL